MLVVRPNLRKDHLLFAQRIRQAARKGCKVFAINAMAYDGLCLRHNSHVVASADWTQALADACGRRGQT